MFSSAVTAFSWHARVEAVASASLRAASRSFNHTFSVGCSFTVLAVALAKHRSLKNQTTLLKRKKKESRAELNQNRPKLICGPGCCYKYVAVLRCCSMLWIFSHFYFYSNFFQLSKLIQRTVDGCSCIEIKKKKNMQTKCR